MRTSALVLSALLSTGVLAHPFHPHPKRDDAKLVNSYTKDGTLYKEYETVKTVVVNGQAPKVAEKVEEQPAPVVQEKKVEHHKPSHKHDEQPKVETPKIETPKIETPKVETPKVETPKVETPKKDTPKQSEKVADKPKESSGGSCSGEAAGGDAFTASSCSGGKTILDQFNEMRGQWNPSLKDHPYTWDSTLAKNSHDTAWAPDGMKEANTMGHKLFSGSMGQCIAGSFGGPNAFYEAAKMWMCEIQKGPFCDKQTYSVGDNPTGHAEIIQRTDKTKVGCYNMYKNDDPSSGSAMWVCDFA